MICEPVIPSAFTTDLARNPVEPNTVTINPLKLDRPPVPRRFFTISTVGKTSLLMTRGKKSALRSVGTLDKGRNTRMLTGESETQKNQIQFR